MLCHGTRVEDHTDFGWLLHGTQVDMRRTEGGLTNKSK
jgi:hypothetical protein